MSLEQRITNLLHRVPGYTGYRDKENRRDEDKRLRVTIADSILQSVARLTAYNADLASARELTALSGTETLVSRLRLLGDRIRTASYGYGGLFTERSVDEAALDQLRQFDLTLQRETSTLDNLIGSIAASTPPRDEDVRALSEEIDRLELLFASRSEVVDTAAPSRDQQVLDLLDSATPPPASPLLSVKRGDTLSLLGDNYVANATIAIATNDGPLNLVRVSEEESGATWLMGSGIEVIPSARLTETEGNVPAASALQRATATLESMKGREEGVAVQYSVDAADDSVAIALVIGNRVRLYRGNQIRDIDVEVYGAA